MASSDTRELVLQSPVDTASMHSRGRNGGLTITRIVLHTRTAGAPPDQGYVSLWAYSKRSGEYPPIMLTVSLEDAVVLAEQMLGAVQAVLAPALPTPRDVPTLPGEFCTTCGQPCNVCCDGNNGERWCARCCPNQADPDHVQA